MAGIKQFDPEETLDKATALFRRKGFAATSMQDIVEALGIGRGSLYQTFGNKQQLYIAALKNYAAQRQRQINKLLSDASSAKEGIRSLLYFIVEQSQGEGGRQGCMIGNTAIERSIHDPESEQVVIDAIQQNVALLTQLLQQAKKEGDLPKDQEPMIAALFLQTGLQGLTFMGVALPGLESLYAIADKLFVSVFH